MREREKKVTVMKLNFNLNESEKKRKNILMTKEGREGEVGWWRRV